MQILTLQICLNQQWHDALILEFPNAEQGFKGAISASYTREYALACINNPTEPLFACSLNFPPDLFQTYRQSTWFSWLDDIRPAGSSERYWAQQLGVSHLTESQRAFTLLQHGTIAPIGHCRIKEALPARVGGSQLEAMRFSLDQVAERDSDFLNYAQAMGAASGGATGAGGEAPKFLLRLTPQDEVWIDTYQDDFEKADAHYLVKFPRNKRTQDDCDILRAEFYYYHELSALGVNAIATQGMRLIEGKRYPSLWLPRFDREFNAQGQLMLHGMESVYSVLSKPPATAMRHLDVVAQIVTKFAKFPNFDAQQFVREWLIRDFLNVVFGNTDNHGRNSAFLKTQTSLALSPVFDFAPMKADPEGSMRTITWGPPLEEGGNFNWQAITQNLEQTVPDAANADSLLREIQQMAHKLVGLQARLAERGVPRRILEYPAIQMAALDKKLEQWGLL